MTAKEKAKELLEKMDIDSGSWFMSDTQSKECAIVCVDEIIEALKDNHDYNKCNVSFDYWEQVKKEITLL